TDRRGPDPGALLGDRRRRWARPRRPAGTGVARGAVPRAGPRDRAERTMSGLALVASIVRLTMFEALRRRTLWALVILTAIIVILTGLGFQYLVTEARQRGSGEFRLQLGVSQVLILCAFMFSFILATTAAFLSAPAIAGDVESGV